MDNAGEKARIQEALSYALTQVTNLTDRRLCAQEFWHSLNRKGVIPNDEVTPLIELTIRASKEYEIQRLVEQQEYRKLTEG